MAIAFSIHSAVRVVNAGEKREASAITNSEKVDFESTDFEGEGPVACLGDMVWCNVRQKSCEGEAAYYARGSSVYIGGSVKNWYDVQLLWRGHSAVKSHLWKKSEASTV